MASEPGYGEDHEAPLVVRVEPLGASREAMRTTARERAATHYHPGSFSKVGRFRCTGLRSVPSLRVRKGLNKESHP